MVKISYDDHSIELYTRRKKKDQTPVNENAVVTGKKTGV